MQHSKPPFIRLHSPLCCTTGLECLCSEQGVGWGVELSTRISFRCMRAMILCGKLVGLGIRGLYSPNEVDGFTNSVLQRSPLLCPSLGSCPSRNGCVHIAAEYWLVSEMGYKQALACLSPLITQKLIY